MKQVKSLDEIKSLRKPVRNVNQEQKKRLSSLDNFALWITEHIGTMGFFLVILFWTIIWMGWNVLGPKEYQFDPFPAFVLWLFISNMIQIFLMPLLLIGQNLQSQHAEVRAEAEFEVNVKSEREIETIIQHLENQNEVLAEIQNRLK